MAILNGNPLHGIAHYPSKFQANNWNLYKITAVTSHHRPGPSLTSIFFNVLWNAQPIWIAICFMVLCTISPKFQANSWNPYRVWAVTSFGTNRQIINGLHWGTDGRMGWQQYPSAPIGNEGKKNNNYSKAYLLWKTGYMESKLTRIRIYEGLHWDRYSCINVYRPYNSAIFRYQIKWIRCNYS